MVGIVTIIIQWVRAIEPYFTVEAYGPNGFQSRETVHGGLMDSCRYVAYLAGWRDDMPIRLVLPSAHLWGGERVPPSSYSQLNM